MDPGTQRTWVLDYPCDLQPGDAVTFILNLHGGGSNTGYQYACFPVWELKEQYRLVVAMQPSAHPLPNRKNHALIWTNAGQDNSTNEIADID